MRSIVFLVAGFLATFVAWAADLLPRAKPETVGMSADMHGVSG